MLLSAPESPWWDNADGVSSVSLGISGHGSSVHGGSECIAVAGLLGSNLRTVGVPWGGSSLGPVCHDCGFCHATHTECGLWGQESDTQCFLAALTTLLPIHHSAGLPEVNGQV